MPLVFCRVSAQSVGKVESVDSVLKGEGMKTSLCCGTQMKERCGVEIGWQEGRAWDIGRGLRMRWNGFREGRCLFGVITKRDWYLGLDDWTEKLITSVRLADKTISAEALPPCLSLLRIVDDMLCVRLFIRLRLQSNISPFECANVYMPLYTNTKDQEKAYLCWWACCACMQIKIC